MPVFEGVPGGRARQIDPAEIRVRFEVAVMEGGDRVMVHNLARPTDVLDHRNERIGLGGRRFIPNGKVFQIGGSKFFAES